MRLLATALAAALLTVPVAARTPATGYLTPAQRPDLTAILPGPPVADSPRAQSDARVFTDSRALADSARWTLATADVSSDLPARFADAIGFPLDLSQLPATRRVLERLGADRSAAVNAAKTHWQSRRPFVGNQQPICEPRRPDLAAQGDYPSGHTANGWTFALVMAELLPDRAGAILARGRQYGDSRWICGSHTLSAVEGGYLAASAVVAAEHGAAAFRADMDAARVELARYRAGRAQR